MNKMTRKLVLSILTVVLTVVALGTTTFAWFTITNTATVQPFQAEIIADQGIEIAIGNGDPMTLEWKTTLTTLDIYNYMEATYGVDGFRFNHVTTPDGRNFYTLGTTGVGDGTVVGYLQLPIHFRSDSTSQINWTYVSLTGTQTSFTTRVAFTDSKGVSHTANSSLNVNPADAIRISITGMVGGLTATKAYENPVSATNTVLGFNENSDFRGTTEDVQGVPTYIGTNGAQNYFYRSNAILPGASDAVNTVLTQQTIESELVLDMASGQTLVSDTEYYGQVTVRIWFEGWDAEGYNALLGKKITASFRFQG
ncbi:MAG: hypothetical protein Q7I99_02930 [Acholeplasmataceae bacterium]|nr:hypothetical protein [Acholeplasmataceae bacterium]